MKWLPAIIAFLIGSLAIDAYGFIVGEDVPTWGRFLAGFCAYLTWRLPS